MYVGCAKNLSHWQLSKTFEARGGAEPERVPIKGRMWPWRSPIFFTGLSVALLPCGWPQGILVLFFSSLPLTFVASRRIRNALMCAQMEGKDNPFFAFKNENTKSFNFGAGKFSLSARSRRKVSRRRKTCARVNKWPLKARRSHHYLPSPNSYFIIFLFWI